MERPRELHGESTAQDKDEGDDGMEESNCTDEVEPWGQPPLYLTAHLVQCPEQVIEVHDSDGVPHGREGAAERVGLSLRDRT